MSRTNRGLPVLFRACIVFVLLAMPGLLAHDSRPLRLFAADQLNPDYEYLFREASPDAPHVDFYPSQTAIAGHAFVGRKPRLTEEKPSVVWRLVAGPEGMEVDEKTGVPSWPVPSVGHHAVTFKAESGAGHDIAEFALIVVEDDIPGGQVLVTRHVDFVVTPEIAAWFEKWQPHGMITAQFEYMRKLIGHAPSRDGKQVMKYVPADGGGGLSGNPATSGPGWWSCDDINAWDLGIWHHEVGHNFNGQAPVTFYSDIEGYGGMYHHHVPLLNTPMHIRTYADPESFGLTGEAAQNYCAWYRPADPRAVEGFRNLRNWLASGKKLGAFAGSYDMYWQFLRELAHQHGVETLEKTLRSMRTDGISASLRESANTPGKVNALFLCALSHAANSDLRPYYNARGWEYDGEFYGSIDTEVARIVEALPDEDTDGGWKRNPNNGHYYRLTKRDTHWYAAEVEARQFGGHLATVRNAEELQWLQSRFGNYPAVWIGMHCANQPGKWQWISGEEASFTQWGPQEPNDPSQWHFVIMATESGIWCSKSPDGHVPGIIEVPTTPAAPLGELEPLVDVVGHWRHSAGGDDSGEMVLLWNGHINELDGPATWTLEGTHLTLTWPHGDAPGGAWIDRCEVAADGASYAGKNQDDVEIHGTRVRKDLRFRDWHRANGTLMLRDFRLAALDNRTNVVNCESIDGRTEVNIPIDKFSEADQYYIRKRTNTLGR
jgi:hypothetical protein